MPFSLPALIRAFVVWLLLMAAESAQGALRRTLFDPDLATTIRQASVIVGALIIFAITWVCMGWLRIRSTKAALAIGCLWVALTLAFEFAIALALGQSWSSMAADYDLLHGGLMPLGLLAMALTPWLVRLLQGPRDLDQGSGAR